MRSKTSSTSSARGMGTWMGCEERSASSLSAAACEVWTTCSHMFHSGTSASATRLCIILAKPSLSQRSSHHCIVTRLPNHWCESSWVITDATRCFWLVETFASSQSRSTSRYVTIPQFSMAPAAKSGTAIMSILGSGKATPKKSSRNSSARTATPRANRHFSALPCTLMTRTRTPVLVTACTNSNSPITSASKYVLIFGVSRNSTTCFSASVESTTRLATGVLATTSRCLSTVTVRAKTALRAGSSQHGKARRASMASNWVQSMVLGVVPTVYEER
mmetsp:Transcript_28630/g.71866  ORF Transcript_28630/g.71866 Transcript_28630/m.71866 type:complete len:276 (+) Transcript_28630:1776-2603(+)